MAEKELMFINVEIPIRGYLKKYVASYKDVEPFEVSLSKCHFSAIFIEPLKKKHYKPTDELKPHFNDTITLKMGPAAMKENRFWWEASTINYIDLRLKAMFDQQLIDYITMENEKKGDILESIYNFMSYYNLGEDDIKVETLFKMYYRARNPTSVVRQQKMQAVIQQHQIYFPD